MQVINSILVEHGHKRDATKELAEEIRIRITGLLALTLPDRHATIEVVEKIAAAGVYPALVGMFGKGSKGKPGSIGFAWPLVLPLAPYWAAAEEAAG
jgi:hypothetical protein